MKNSTLVGTFTRTLSLLATLLVTFSLPQAQAAGKGSLYLGAGGGISNLTASIANPNNIPDVHINEDRDLGYMLYAGYQLADRWGLEGFWGQLGDATVSSISSPTHNGTVDYNVFGIGGVYAHPLEVAQLILKAGVGDVDNDSDVLVLNKSRNQFYYVGVGLQWKISDSGWEGRASYDYFDEDFQFLSLNIFKSFGGS